MPPSRSSYAGDKVVSMKISQQGHIVVIDDGPGARYGLGVLDWRQYSKLRSCWVRAAALTWVSRGALNSNRLPVQDWTLSQSWTLRPESRQAQDWIWTQEWRQVQRELHWLRTFSGASTLRCRLNSRSMADRACR